MSKRKRIVSDTGPLITLEKLADGHGFIRLLYEKILVPQAVLDELTQGYFSSVDAYLEHYAIRDLIEVKEADIGEINPELGKLDPGEQEAIQLALTENLPLLIEEEAGRRVAQNLGIKISGIAGEILRAFKADQIEAEDSAKMLKTIYEAGRINKKIFEGILNAIRRHEA